MKKPCFLLLCFLGCFAILRADAALNILRESTFEPVVFLGRISAIRGWSMEDHARDFYSKKDNIYVSGDDCFTLFCRDKVFTIAMKRPLHSCYKAKKGNSITLQNHSVNSYPPAPVYHIKGKLRAQNGRIFLDPAYKLPKSSDWQTFDFKSQVPFRKINLKLSEGAVFSFAELSEVPEYPGAIGSIALPDGGSLDKILLRENASYEERFGVMLWRGWLWRLTGKALPVEIVKELKPVPHALVLMPGREKTGRWSVKVDKNGLLLTYGDPLDAYPALFDYLRRSLGCAFYAADCEKIPVQGSVKVLPEFSFTANPVYNYFNFCHSMTPLQGGADYKSFWVRNRFDYYHLFGSKGDHVFNAAVPQEVYFKEHPEYFCADENNRRCVSYRPYYTQHCLSNPAVMEMAVKNAVEYAKLDSGSRRLVFDTGDSKSHCLCKECVRLNNGTESCSNLVYEFHRKLAKILAKECPRLILEHHSYATRTEPPDDMTPLPDNCNMYVTNLPCSLHFDCELNRPHLERIKHLLPLVKNDVRRFSFMGYQDYRPMWMPRFANEMSKYACDVFFLWDYKSPHPGTSFLVGRWNLGEDPKALLQEFENAYFGKGAPFVNRAYEITEEFAGKYQHRQSEQRAYIWPDRFGECLTVLDRVTLDKILACYEKALAAVPEDRLARKHIYNDIRLYLTEDLQKFRPSSCKNAEELAAYAKRLRLLVNAGREFPRSFDKMMHNVEARAYLAAVTGLEIPHTGKNWANEPVFDKVFANPAAYLGGKGDSFPGEGRYYTTDSFQSFFDFTFDTPPHISDKVVPRNNLILHPAQLMSVEMTFNKQPRHNLLLAVEGLLEKPGAGYTLELAMNGRIFYSGKAGFTSTSWSRMGFSVPAGLLKTGINKLTVKNAARTGGWIAVSEIYTVNPGDDLENLAENRSSLWNFISADNTLKGRLVCENGKIHISCKDKESYQLSFFRRKHENPKAAARAGAEVTLKIKAAGSGSITLGANRYTPYEIDRKTGKQQLKLAGYTKHIGNLGKCSSKSFELAPEEKEFVYTFKMPKKAGLFFPFVCVNSDTEAAISGFDCEIKP